MIAIDGSQGEGGGQILRTALSLSLMTGKAFVLDQIRAKRPKPGLLRQHLTAVHAAKSVGCAEVHGDELGSSRIEFKPNELRNGKYEFSIGTAGSSVLVAQTILLPLLYSQEASTVSIQGGTHNSFSPPFDFLMKAYGAILRQMGANVKFSIIRHGFFPAGGGEIQIDISPCKKLIPLELRPQKIQRVSAQILHSHLPFQIAQREYEVVRQELDLIEKDVKIVTLENTRGPGNVVMTEVEFESYSEIFTGFAKRGVPAEKVAREPTQELKRFLESNAIVGEHLADQLLLPMALAGGGSFSCSEITEHFKSNVTVIQSFLPHTQVKTQFTGKYWEVFISKR
jgi:RNA 3'-terminal phosphate cyclase (ATP)